MKREPARPARHSTQVPRRSGEKASAAVGAALKRKTPRFAPAAIGTEDQLWSSCAYALRIESRLNAARFPYPHVLYRYQGAGHTSTRSCPTSPAMPLPTSPIPLAKGTRCPQTPMPTPAYGRAFSVSSRIPQDRKASSPRRRPRHH
ncbi:MAG: hypothetical protein JO286_23840 [Solirubrobacterales bacterium]|nr:hypothetical protein [Solirubrobacterales bacterium]